MRRFLPPFALCAALMMVAGPVLAIPGYVEGMEDVPLMAGLQSLPAHTVAFDSPRGRIVAAYASGTVKIGQVQAFYATTLPQLGWQAVAPGVFRREGETLRLEYDQAGAALTVRFALSPN